MFVFLTACTTPSTPPPSTTDVVPSLEPTDLPEPTADTAVEVPEIDCRHLPVMGEGTVLGTPRAYHGIAFDSLGQMASSDNTNLMLSTSSTETSLFVPNLSTLQQMAYLASGDLVIARDDGGRISKVSPSGAVETLASGVGAYGVEIGPDQMIYTANQTRIDRIDPTGVTSPVVWLPTTVINVPKVLTFDRTGENLYVGTNQRGGNVFRVEIDANGDPITPPTLLGQTQGSWHDGIALDACGNLYVNEYFTRSLYRLPHGAESFSAFIRFDQLGGFGDNLYGHGITWGSGLGSWSETSIFLPLPYHANRVGEMPLGIPGRDYNGGNYTVLR